MCLVPTVTGEISDSSFSVRPYRDTGKRREREREREERECMCAYIEVAACTLVFITSLPFPLSLSYRYRIIINNYDNSPDTINCLSCEEEKAKKSLGN